MTPTAKWTTAVLALVWLFTPGPTGTPLAGIPFTDPWVFVFVWVWTLLFLVLPTRADRRAWPWPAAVVVLIALKLAAGLMASPRGLTGTYRCLVGSRTGEPAPDGPRPWRRIDPALQFDDNSLGLTGRSWHLLFYNSRPFWNHPKPALEQPVEPGHEHECLDLAGLSVTWEGTLEVPSLWATAFCPDTDGEWEIVLRQDAGDGGVLERKWAGGPGDSVDAPSLFGVYQATIRYRHSMRSAAVGRGDQQMRFRLRWSRNGEIEDVPNRLLCPDVANRDWTNGMFGTNRAADLFAWYALGGIGLVGAAWLAGMIDWRRVRAEFPGPRLIVFSLALGTFLHGWVRIVRAESRDPHASTLNTYDYKTYLARALAYQHDGEFVPGTVRTTDSPAPPPLVEPLNPWLATLAGALDGRLGPVKYVDDEPDTPANRLQAFYRNPLMDYYLAGLLRLFGERLGLCYLFQALTAAAAVGLVYLVGRLCFGNLAGLLAAAALAADPAFVRFTEFLYAEPPAGLLAPAALAAVLLARRSGRLGWFAAAGLALAAAFLMRPNLALLLPVALAWFVMPGGRTGGARLGRRAAGACVTLLVFALVWSLLPVRNWQLSGRAIWNVTSGPTVLIVASKIPRDRPLDRYIDEAAPADRAKLRERLEIVRALSFDNGDDEPRYGDPLPYDAYPEVNPVLERIAWDYIRENPGRMTGVWAGRFWEIWGAGQKWHPLIYLAVMAAAVPLLLRRRGPEPLLPAAALVVMTLPLVIFFFEPRHRTPCLPVVHVFTGALPAAGLRRLRRLTY